MISVYYDVHCDVCSTWDPDCTSDTRHEALGRAIKRGWKRERVEGHVVDLCPKCAPVKT